MHFRFLPVCLCRLMTLFLLLASFLLLAAGMPLPHTPTTPCPTSPHAFLPTPAPPRGALRALPPHHSPEDGGGKRGRPPCRGRDELIYVWRFVTITNWYKRNINDHQTRLPDGSVRVYLVGHAHSDAVRDNAVF